MAALVPLWKNREYRGDHKKPFLYAPLVFREYRKQLAGARGRLLVIVNLKNLQELIEMISDSLRSGPGEGTDLLLIIKNLEVAAPDSL